MELIGQSVLSCEGEGEEQDGFLQGSFVPSGLRSRGTLGELLFLSILGGHSPGSAAAEGPRLVSQQQAWWCRSRSAYVNADLSADSSLDWIKPCMIVALARFKTVLIYIWIPMGALGMSRAQTILGRRNRPELARIFVPLLVTRRKECTHHFNI